jgi:1-acyl-sn-glycerol-3-phosphate acyltransferase
MAFCDRATATLASYSSQTQPSAMLAVRSVIFNFLFYLNLIVLMIVGLPTMFGGRRAVMALARLWGAISVWLLERICGLRLEYRGLENIPAGGVIIAAKHQSFLETFALLKYAPDFAIILKRQLTYIPIFGLYLVVSKQIAIDRGRGRQALQQIAAEAKPVLAAGRQVMIYPEGTRRPPGAPPRYKHGVAALYAMTGAQCLPVAVNTGLFWRRRSFRRRPGVAVIEYLPPIAPALDRAVFADQLQNAIETACARLNAEAIAADPSLEALVAEGAKFDDATNHSA